MAVSLPLLMIAGLAGAQVADASADSDAGVLPVVVVSASLDEVERWRNQRP